MKSINLSDDLRRDAFVGVEREPRVSGVVYVEASGRPARSVRYIKATHDTDWNAIQARAGTMAAAAELIAREDPEIDYTLTGKRLTHTRRIFLHEDGAVAYTVKWQELLFDTDGRETGRREYVDREANISGEVPLRWTGKFISKHEAALTFVSRRIYQLKHVNGLTFEFLYNMAERLHRKNALLALGAGRDGTDPIVLVRGGSAYRGFLQGRVRGEDYMLLLHLSNLELKAEP